MARTLSTISLVVGLLRSRTDDPICSVIYEACFSILSYRTSHQVAKAIAIAVATATAAILEACFDPLLYHSGPCMTRNNIYSTTGVSKELLLI
jgi:hypothetical protein